MSTSLVFLSKENIPLTTTKIIADSLDYRANDVLKLCEKYLADLQEFGHVPFKTVRNELKNNVVLDAKIAYLNEPQATLLICYMRNSEKVRKFKVALVKAFYEMRTRLEAEKIERIEAGHEWRDTDRTNYDLPWWVSNSVRADYGELHFEDFLYKGVKLSTLTFRCHTWYSIPDLKKLCKEYFPGDFTFAGGCIPRFDLGIDPKAVWLPGMTKTERVPPMRHAKNAWYISEYALPGMFPNPVELPTLFLVLLNEVKPAIMRHCKPVTDFPERGAYWGEAPAGSTGSLLPAPAKCAAPFAARLESAAADDTIRITRAEYDHLRAAEGNWQELLADTRCRTRGMLETVESLLGTLASMRGELQANLAARPA